MDENKTPLIRLSKKTTFSKKEAWLIRASSFVVALIIGAFFFAAMGHNPFDAYKTLVTGSLGKATAIRQTIKIAIPLLGTGLALAPCFKMRYWNIGAEGQITAGAIAATFFALNCTDLSKPGLLVLMGIGAAVFGGIWAAIPALFRAKWGTNETLFTLMMNYIAIGLVKWLQGGPWEGRPGSQIIPDFADNAILPKVLNIHCGWIMVILMLVFIYVYMKYTKHGYEIVVIGDSVNTAKYAGMNVEKIIIRTAFLSGAMCGIVGYMVASGANHTLSADVAAGVGFTAITVAWLSQLNPLAMVGIASLLAVLEKGASALQTKMEIPASMSDILTGIILFSMLACEFFINYQITFRSNKKEVAE